MSKNILESFIIIIVSATFAMLLTWPRYQELNDQNLKVAQKKIDLETRQEYFRNLEEVAAEFKNYGPSIIKIESALPDSPNVAALANYLEASAIKEGLILKKLEYAAGDQVNPTKAFTPAQENQNQGQTEANQFSIDLILSGSYPAWKNFITDIEKTSRLVEIETAEIAKDNSQASPNLPNDTNKALNFTVKLIAYFY